MLFTAKYDLLLYDLTKVLKNCLSPLTFLGQQCRFKLGDVYPNTS